MAEYLGKKKPFRGETIRLYEIGRNNPGKAARSAIAALFELSEAFIEFGAPGSPEKPSARELSPLQEKLLDRFDLMQKPEQRALVEVLGKLLTPKSGKTLRRTIQSRIEHLIGPPRRLG
jgi:hypothetical protein